MSPLSAPDNVPFRITLFFGPDKVGEEEVHWRCVFNVKKRSWKGGVQVSVDVSRTQIERLRAALEITAWRRELLAKIADDERAAMAQRIEEVFVQALCTRKLNLVLQSGIEQQNQEIPAQAFTDELDHIARAEADHILAAVRTELDLDDPSCSIL